MPSRSGEAVPPFPAASRPQKLAAPAFHVPPEYTATATPVWLLTGSPETAMEQVTVAG
jgi:hypothetical protein